MLQLFFTFFDWQTSKLAHHLLQFFISYWEKLLKLIKSTTQSYVLLLNLFLFLSTFSVSLNDFFQIACLQVSSWQIFSVNKLLCDLTIFFCIQLFPTFFMVQVLLGSRFFRVRAQGLGPSFRSSPTLKRIFLTLKKKKCENKSKVHKVLKIHHYTIIK